MRLTFLQITSLSAVSPRQNPINDCGFFCCSYCGCACSAGAQKMLISLFPIAAACNVAPAPVLAAVVAHHLQEDLRRQAEGAVQAHLEPHSQGRADPQGSRRLSLSLGRLQRSSWHVSRCSSPPSAAETCGSWRGVDSSAAAASLTGPAESNGIRSVKRAACRCTLLGKQEELFSRRR